ncbi:hypothetical protein TanjilG_30399 [Lupinus angustifolius]|uniref:protein NDR1-like n=1 Tax=Lupinus angustifolius TaxID=3871 RepID=UPI00090E7B93|nr:PREDICTED: protein NDR1-like [Lupinus angustifolius]OIV91177.1 hypothetical protein TanjilG_30399 [Lupinus angustifolius]
MYGNDHIHNPHAPGPNPRPLKRHHTAQYYMQRVQDSLTTRISKILCSIFLSILFILGLIAFIFWLSLRPHRPRFFINEFSIPGLAQESGFLNAQITFEVTARNSNQNVGVYYESMSGSVFYKNKKIGSMPLLIPFYQDHKTTTMVDGTLGGARLNVSSQRWAEFQHDRAHGTVVFRLELTSVIRFRISTWDSKRHTMHADCNVVLGPNGHILPAYRNMRCPVYFS